MVDYVIRHSIKPIPLNGVVTLSRCHVQRDAFTQVSSSGTENALDTYTDGSHTGILGRGFDRPSWLIVFTSYPADW